MVTISPLLVCRWLWSSQRKQKGKMPRFLIPLSSVLFFHFVVFNITQYILPDKASRKTKKQFWVKRQNVMLSFSVFGVSLHVFFLCKWFTSPYLLFCIHPIMSDPKMLFYFIFNHQSWLILEGLSMKSYNIKSEIIFSLEIFSAFCAILLVFIICSIVSHCTDFIIHLLSCIRQ